MAISTKAELKTLASDWLDGPSWFDAKADNLLVLAEARLNRQLKGRLAQQDTPLVGVVSSRYIALPADFSEPVALWLTTYGRNELTPCLPSTLPVSTVNGTPSSWAVDGSNIALNAPCDRAHTLTLRYFQKFALTLDADTNWLLTDWPDTYLAALLVEAYAFKRDAEAASAWDGRLQASIEEINQIDSRGDALAGLSFDPALITRRYFDITTGQ